ncbi:Crp/Fnr family transcriptional regulator [Mariniflexile aquimaris]|uniref:Crp/Fnr family transcriptional regulator n=1 Tax=Mariniflexile aquimaris TaxID=881009 RepID=A0ABW3BTV8_9FLAO
MNPIIAFLNSFGNVSEDMFAELKEISVYKKIDSGEQIVKLQEVPTKLYILLSGVIRCYLSSESGKDYNKSFYLPISFVGSLTALIKNKPSSFVFETLTACEVYEVDYKKFMDLCKENSGVNTLYSKVLEVVYMKYENRLMDLIALDAKGRYLELRKQVPMVETLIPQYHIASYLGITPVQLSRIRRKLDSY